MCSVSNSELRFLGKITYLICVTLLLAKVEEGHVCKAVREALGIRKVLLQGDSCCHQTHEQWEHNWNPTDHA